MGDKSPSQLAERELFTEYVELLKRDEKPVNAYEEVDLQERQARLLAEIGDRLEELEAVKALLDTPSNMEQTDSQTEGSEGASNPYELSF